MKPQKALELVESYAKLTKQIKDCKKRISDNLALCHGISGNRHNVLIPRPEYDSKGREPDLHLTQWYTPEHVTNYGWEYHDISEAEHGEECPYCYAAHIAIQERKDSRKKLSYVKAAISRSTK